MRRIRVTLAIACLVLGGGSVAVAAPLAGQNTPATAPISDSAHRLSLLLNPSDKLLDIAMRGFEVGINTALKNNPDDAAVYNQNPGLLDIIVAAGKPIVRKHVHAAIPAHQQKFAEFYARKFSAEEIEQLIAFYSTPTGSKVIAGIYAGADLGSIAEAVGDKGDRPLTAEAVRNFTSSAGAQLLPGLDSDDWKALFMFASSPVYVKLKNSAPELHQLAVDIANEPDPAMDAELSKAVEAAVQKYMAEKRSGGKR